MLPGEILPTLWDSIHMEWDSVRMGWACLILSEWAWATILMQWVWATALTDSEWVFTIHFSILDGAGDLDSILASTLGLETECTIPSVEATTTHSGVVISLAHFMEWEDQLLLMDQSSSYPEVKMATEILSTVLDLAVVLPIPMGPVL